jgi:leader peptidase (prepilin peptidase)/N-methyltransferase
MDNYIIYCVAVFVVGLCIGSFLNVCICRIPEGKSVVSPSSSCPKCGYSIRWFENIPVLSYILLRGRCSSCGERISPEYPVVEFMTGLLFLFLFLRYGMSAQFFVNILLVSALIVITFIDLRLQIIPDVISVPGIVVGFVCSFVPGGVGWMASLLGILVGGGVLFAVAWGYYLVTRREGMGGGDIKLLAMIGAFLGWHSIPFIIFTSALLGAVVGIVVMLWNRQDMKYAIPFGPFLSAAACAYMLFGREVVVWYLGSLGYY